SRRVSSRINQPCIERELCEAELIIGLPLHYPHTISLAQSEPLVIFSKIPARFHHRIWLFPAALRANARHVFSLLECLALIGEDLSRAKSVQVFRLLSLQLRDNHATIFFARFARNGEPGKKNCGVIVSKLKR